MRRISPYTIALAAAFVACVPAANWLIQHVGTVCIAGKNVCLLPVGFGLMAPSGALLIGAALALRDALVEAAGRRFVLAAIALGAAASGIVSPAHLVLASVVAFAVSELFDFAAYQWIRPWSRPAAILWSGLLGAAVDSLLFSWIAFGAVSWSLGLLLAKIYASVAYAVSALFHRRLRMHLLTTRNSTL